MTIPQAIAALAPDGRLTLAQKRRFLIDLCLRRIRPGAGSSLEFLQRRTAMNSWPDLRPILGDISWLVVGGVATRAYMPERATKDLDILVRRADGEAVKAKLQAAGYEWVAPLAISGFLARSPEGIELDVIFGDEVWVEEALRLPQLDAAGYPVIGLPYLVLMKMAAVRTQDVADLSRMLGLAAEEHVRQVRDTVQRYAPEELDDLESLIYLGRLEVESARDAGV